MATKKRGIDSIKSTGGNLLDIENAQLNSNDLLTSADKAVANGVATLDGSGKIPASQLTVAAMEYKGGYNASTNTPDLTSAYTGSTGDVYTVTVAGTQDLNGSIASTSFEVGDQVIWDGSTFVHQPKDTTLTDAEVKTAYENNADTNAFTDAEQSKLSGIEAGADVTDTANVTAAGALMDSEVTNLAQVKAFDSSDYATAAQGALADSAMQQADLDTKQDALSDGDFTTVSAGSTTAVTISSNDGASSTSDLLGTSGGTYGRIDINDTSNIRINPAIAVGDIIRVTDGSGDGASSTSALSVVAA